MNVKNETNPYLEEERIAMNERIRQPIRMDRRKRKRRAPANHPWRQYKLTGNCKTG